MLEIKKISSGYGKKQVLYDVSLEVNKGEVVLLTGGNGSGKSTLLKCIYNLLPCWSGKIFFEGEKINGLKPSELIRKGIVYIPQRNFYFENLTIQENLEVSGTIYSNKILKNRIEIVYNSFGILKKFQNRKPFYMSGGERQILAFGLGIIHVPKIILFDEPLSGMDLEYSILIKKKIQKLNKDNNISFLLIEHEKVLYDISKKLIELKLGKSQNKKH